MSSIFGLCHLDKKPVDQADLGLALNELNHWQADHVNTWVHDAVGLGQLVLYNSPESFYEKQLHDSLYQLSVTADARIDNREEIYKLLQLAPAEGALLPDSALILLLYKKYGGDCVNYLIGDFAFAIWDEAKRILFCARDHMGVKPFFYYCDDHLFAFASEKKGLLCLPGIDKTIDQQFFYNQVFFPVIQAANTTLYKHIRRLPPAHTLTIHALNNKRVLKQYWTLDADTEIKFSKKEEYYEGLLHHFDEAVKCRVRSIYPVGAQLSGGLDSSAITGAASSFLKAEGKQLITFSNVGEDGKPAFFPDLEDERPFIDAVNAFNGITDSVLVTKDIWNNVSEEIDFSLRTNDGLEMVSPTWLMPIKKAAMQRGVRTLLSGFPGDEMVSYMGWFYFLDFLDKRQYAKYFSAKSTTRFNKLKPFMSPGIEFYLHKLKNVMTMNSREMKNLGDFFGMAAKDRYSKGDVVWEDTHYRERFKSYRHYQKYRLLKPQIALRMEAETRFGLYYKTEPRYPMADIRLTQFYLSIPNHLKYEGDLNRTFYRSALKQYLPAMVLQRDNKRGNIMPFKFTTEVFKERQQLLLELLSNFENKSLYSNIYIQKTAGHVYNKLKFIEILKWLKINFGKF